MRKTIILAEYLRLREIHEVLDRECPVCYASHNLKKRHKDISCSSDLDKSACHSTVQIRCKDTLEATSKFQQHIEDEIVKIRAILYNKYEVWDFDLDELFEEFEEKRHNERCD